ncbi:MAG: hypothetical protein ACK41C_18655 [Phenylobacterium sp.]|jgi:uncharacterized protein (TIGR02588 family)|uniref:hypothetical protein n=1 Tax=Phenylobacterium sp. TaxID=1871053 RepID=UPI0039198AEA
MAKGRPKPPPKSGPLTPLLEYVSACAGLSLTLALIAVIAWDAARSDGGPPAVTAEVRKVVATPAGHVVEVRARNIGQSPAAAVTIEGELIGPGGGIETAETTFDYIPERSAREGGLFFQGDPAMGRLSLRAKGYVSP